MERVWSVLLAGILIASGAPFAAAEEEKEESSQIQSILEKVKEGGKFQLTSRERKALVERLGEDQLKALRSYLQENADLDGDGEVSTMEERFAAGIITLAGRAFSFAWKALKSGQRLLDFLLEVKPDDVERRLGFMERLLHRARRALEHVCELRNLELVSREEALKQLLQRKLDRIEERFDENEDAVLDPDEKTELDEFVEKHPIYGFVRSLRETFLDEKQRVLERVAASEVDSDAVAFLAVALRGEYLRELIDTIESLLAALDLDRDGRIDRNELGELVKSMRDPEAALEARGTVRDNLDLPDIDRPDRGERGGRRGGRRPR